MKTSDVLQPGCVYTRRDLAERFGIIDATIRTGVFHPKGHDSVWLFVTEHKTVDRTQYTDKLNGNILRWDGQTMGRTDDLIIEHRVRGLELVLFYREEKDRYPGFGFRYEGVFEYVSHQGGKPAHFILQRSASQSSLPAGFVADTIDLG